MTASLRPTDPRRIHPQAIRFRLPSSVETTAAPELVAAIVDGTRARRVQVEQRPILWFGIGGSQSPVPVGYREVEPGDPTVPNGSLIRIRGTGARA